MYKRQVLPRLVHIPSEDGNEKTFILLEQVIERNIDKMCIRDRALNVSLENHHRAVDDAACTAEIFVKFIEMVKERGMENLDDVNHMVSTSPVSYTHLDVYKRQIFMWKHDKAFL